MRSLLLPALISIPLFLPSGLDGGQPAPKAATKDLPPGHFRVTFRKLLDVGDSFVQELTIETPEPAEVTIEMLRKGTGAGNVILTKRQAGRNLASPRGVLLLDYHSATKEHRFIKKSYLRFALMELGEDGAANGGSANEPAEAPDAKSLDDILKQKLKPGDYPYTGRLSKDKGLEVLSVGENRILLYVNKPRSKELKAETLTQMKSGRIDKVLVGDLETALNAKLPEGFRKALDLGGLLPKIWSSRCKSPI